MTDSTIDDATLAALIKDAGLKSTPDELRNLLRGINAAPEPPDADLWLALAVPDATPDLADRLRQAKALLAGVTDRHGPALADRVPALRKQLAAMGLDGFVIPCADAHQSEYIPASAERLAWLTGFAGSAGLAIVLRDRAALFVDGRYTLQAPAQADGAIFDFKHLIDDPHAEWLADNSPAGGRVGFDPWLHTADWVRRVGAALEKSGATLVAVEENPVDAVWTDQPPQPLSPVVPHDEAYAGRSSADKRAALGAELEKGGVAAAVISAPDAIAWLLNIRGGDVPRTPLPLSFALLRSDGQVDLFIDQRKLAPALERHLGNQVAIQPPEALGPALDALGEGGPTVRIDRASASAWIDSRLRDAGAKVKADIDICALPRARKNAVEMAGCRAAHVRDGAAVARFLAWLERVSPGGGISEIGAAEHLRAFRAEQKLYRDDSFDTITGAGPNGAIVHYRVSEETNRILDPGSLYLVDSGAQYLDGTTDITRTVAVGTPDAEMRRCFTLVLKGHIALASVRFPKGTTGSQIDVLARQFLWAAGMDYDHGTGHGVGSYLGVHEGPARISKMPNSVALEPGMILSNEPGYYRTGAYGIRIENLVLVRSCDDLPDAEREMLEFETVTLAPIDLRLVEPTLMTADEIAWLDAYHNRVRDVVGPGLSGEAADWLVTATTPLGS